MIDRLDQRRWPVGVSIVFVTLGLTYIFFWAPVVRHVSGLWLSPNDLFRSYLNASQVAHGHFGSIYEAQNGSNYVEFPGILAVFAPFGAFSSSFHTAAFEVTQHGLVPLPTSLFGLHGYALHYVNPVEIFSGNAIYVLRSGWVEVVDPFALLLSCSVLFASDALAQHLDVTKQRRALLIVVEAILLWNVTILWGHPEDAVAVALAMYSLILALKGRFGGSGWLFGGAVVFQPLVLLILPVLFAIGGRRRMLPFGIRTVLPSVVALSVPLAAGFGPTTHAVLDQPTSFTINHVTPWTSLSPHLGYGEVAAGPIRILAILLAVALGIWANKRWLQRADLLVWSCSLALALRIYTDSVMTPYYSWAPLAFAVVVAARRSRERFAIAITLAVVTTVVGQWSIYWVAWWIVQVIGVTGVILVSFGPTATAEAPRSSRTAPRVRAAAKRPNAKQTRPVRR